MGKHSHQTFVTVVSLALVASACASHERQPRPTLLTASSSSPPPPPQPNEVRIDRAELYLGAPQPAELAPGEDFGMAAHRALDAVQNDLIQCYVEILPASPDAAGGLDVQLDVDEQGHVSRVTLDVAPTGGFEHIQPCVRRVLGGLHLEGVHPHGQYASRVYAFHGVSVERTGTAPFTLHAPPPPPRAARPARHGRHAASAPVASPAPSASPASAPRTGPGVIEPPEIVETLTANAPAFQACYGAVLRHAHGAHGSGTLAFTITPRGTVAAPSVTGLAGPMAGASHCVSEALRGVAFRVSGIETHVHQPIAFQP